jgi:alkyldihydroxyacetonephosphate synthase
LVSPAGVSESRRLPASGAGPSPDRLALGSEGTLGVITEAWMRVLPRPRFRSRASVLFDDFARAVEAVRAVAQSGLHPSNCRLLDDREAKLNRVVADGSSVLILGFEASDLSVRGRVEQDRPWYERQAPAPFLDVLRAAKRTLDPRGILNPGVLVA